MLNRLFCGARLNKGNRSSTSSNQAAIATPGRLDQAPKPSSHPIENPHKPPPVKAISPPPATTQPSKSPSTDLSPEHKPPRLSLVFMRRIFGYNRHVLEVDPNTQLEKRSDSNTQLDSSNTSPRDSNGSFNEEIPNHFSLSPIPSPRSSPSSSPIPDSDSTDSIAEQHSLHTHSSSAQRAPELTQATTLRPASAPPLAQALTQVPTPRAASASPDSDSSSLNTSDISYEKPSLTIVDSNGNNAILDVGESKWLNILKRRII